LFNGLNEQLSEILAVGKILYKATDAVKVQDYTFNQLKKLMRIITKPASERLPKPIMQKIPLIQRNKAPR
jgi:hypothetical protein